MGVMRFGKKIKGIIFRYLMDCFLKIWFRFTYDFGINCKLEVYVKLSPYVNELGKIKFHNPKGKKPFM